MHTVRLGFYASAVVLLLGACTKAPVEKTETADEFVARLNTELLDLSKEGSAAAWAYNTYINQDTELLQAKADERLKAYLSKAIAESKRYDGQTLKPETKRAINLLRLGAPVPAPDDAAKRAELAKLSAKLEGVYGAAKYCPNGPDSCKDQGQLVKIMATSRKYDELLDAWTG